MLASWMRAKGLYAICTGMARMHAFPHARVMDASERHTYMHKTQHASVVLIIIILIIIIIIDVVVVVVAVIIIVIIPEVDPHTPVLSVLWCAALSVMHVMVLFRHHLAQG